MANQANFSRLTFFCCLKYKASLWFGWQKPLFNYVCDSVSVYTKHALSASVVKDD